MVIQKCDSTRHTEQDETLATDCFTVDSAVVVRSSGKVALVVVRKRKN